MTSKFSQPYAKKKQHIYAYRQRKSAEKMIEKLSKIVKNSNKKDLWFLLRGVNNLWWAINDGLGTYDDIPKSGERKETSLEKRIKTGAVDIQPVIRYVCPVCKKPGFLFSPNLDLKENELKRYILHIDWNKRETRFCELPGLKKTLIAIHESPVEGILTVHREGIILMP